MTHRTRAAYIIVVALTSIAHTAILACVLMEAMNKHCPEILANITLVAVGALGGALSLRGMEEERLDGTTAKPPADSPAGLPSGR